MTTSVVFGGFGGLERLKEEAGERSSNKSSEFGVGLSEFCVGLSEFCVGLSEFSLGLSEFSLGLSEFSLGLSVG